MDAKVHKVEYANDNNNPVSILQDYFEPDFSRQKQTGQKRRVFLFGFSQLLLYYFQDYFDLGNIEELDLDLIYQVHYPVGQIC